MLTAFNHSGNYGHPPANFLCRIEGERERERENNCELYSSQWNISLQDINSPIIHTSRESRVRQIDLNKGVHLYSCRCSFLFFFFPLINLICRDFSKIWLPITLIQRREIFLPFLYFCPLSREKFLSSILKSIAIRCESILRYSPHKTYGYLFALWSEFYKLIHLDGDR